MQADLLSTSIPPWMPGSMACQQKVETSPADQFYLLLPLVVLMLWLNGVKDPLHPRWHFDRGSWGAVCRCCMVIARTGTADSTFWQPMKVLNVCNVPSCADSNSRGYKGGTKCFFFYKPAITPNHKSLSQTPKDQVTQQFQSSIPEKLAAFHETGQTGAVFHSQAHGKVNGKFYR